MENSNKNPDNNLKAPLTRTQLKAATTRSHYAALTQAHGIIFSGAGFLPLPPELDEPNCADLAQDALDIHDRIAALLDAISAAIEALNNLQSALSTAQAELRYLNKRRREAENELAEIAKAIKDFQANPELYGDIELLYAWQREWTAKLDGLNAEIAAKEAEIGAREAALAAKQAELDALNDTLQREQQAADAVAAEQARLGCVKAAQRGAIRSKAKAQASPRKAHIVTTEWGDVTVLPWVPESELTDCDLLQARLNALNDSIATLNRQIAQINEQLRQNHTRQDTTKTAIAHLQSQLKGLNAELQKVEDAIYAYLANPTPGVNIEALYQQQAALQGQIRAKEATLDTATDRLEALKREANNLTNNRIYLESARSLEEAEKREVLRNMREMGCGK